jgi:hypothetical protein
VREKRLRGLGFRLIIYYDRVLGLVSFLVGSAILTETGLIRGRASKMGGIFGGGSLGL